jgi:catechol 2,3-dioxygenase-like lactoylglutathione lyase family enzyme
VQREIGKLRTWITVHARTMPNALVDHLSFPSFDAEATHRFYTEVMEIPLSHAQSGISAQWRRPYLLFSYSFGHGVSLSFFEFDGIERPKPYSLPRDNRHIGLHVPSEAEFDRWIDKLERHRVEYAIERHVDGRHAYFVDPNGVMFEISAALPPTQGKRDRARRCKCSSIGSANVGDGA